MRVLLFVLVCIACTVLSIFWMGFGIEELRHPHNGGIPDGNTPLILVGALMVPSFIAYLIGENMFGEGVVSQLLNDWTAQAPVWLAAIITLLIGAAYYVLVRRAADFIHHRKEMKWG